MIFFIPSCKQKNISVHVFPVCTCVRSFHHCFHHCFHHLFHSSGDSSYHKSHLTDGGGIQAKNNFAAWVCFWLLFFVWVGLYGYAGSQAIILHYRLYHPRKLIQSSTLQHSMWKGRHENATLSSELVVWHFTFNDSTPDPSCYCDFLFWGQ